MKMEAMKKFEKHSLPFSWIIVAEFLVPVSESLHIGHSQILGHQTLWTADMSIPA